MAFDARVPIFRLSGIRLSGGKDRSWRGLLGNQNPKTKAGKSGKNRYPFHREFPFPLVCNLGLGGYRKTQQRGSDKRLQAGFTAAEHGP